VLYAAVYTPLKQLSVANTWVGALVGAIPPLMGWAAAAGQLELGAGVLAGLLYFWQLPHFMALAYLYRADYAAGGYRMLPLIDATGRRTALVALRNSLYMVPLGFAACALGVTTPPFAWEAAALSAGMAAGAAAFLARPAQASARRLFLMSLVHLPALQLACVAHRVPNTAAARADAPATLSEWSQRHRDALAEERSPPRQDAIRSALAGGLSVAPFPLLPVPRTVASLQCPSRAACQGSADVRTDVRA
jgi:protoheme IX farnesyltransferase